MAISILDILRTKQINQDQFNYEMLNMPPWTCYLTPYDVHDLHYIATSRKLAGDANKRYEYIRQIMESRGFKRLGGGTNRVVYRYLEDPRFVAKIATDRVGMDDNPAEFLAQEKIKPFCAKMFQVTPCGTVGFEERVQQILNIEEYKNIAEDVFYMLHHLLGKYVLEDVGTQYFKNIGIRKSFGPVLLDYPYVFELDGAKLICRKQLEDGSICNGEIDYDDGFNELHCMKCWQKYDAVQLKKYEQDNQIVINKGGAYPMKVSIVKGSEILASSNQSDVIVKPQIQRNLDPSIRPSIHRGNRTIAGDIGAIEHAYMKAEEKKHEFDMVRERPEEKEEIKEDIKEEILESFDDMDSTSSIKTESVDREEADQDPYTAEDLNYNRLREYHHLDVGEVKQSGGEMPEIGVVFTNKKPSNKTTIAVDSQFIPSRDE